MQKGYKMAKPVVNHNKKKTTSLFDNLNSLIDLWPIQWIIRILIQSKQFYFFLKYKLVSAWKSNYEDGWDMGHGKRTWGWFLCAGICISTIQYLKQAQDLKTMWTMSWQP